MRVNVYVNCDCLNSQLNPIETLPFEFSSPKKYKTNERKGKKRITTDHNHIEKAFVFIYRQFIRVQLENGLGGMNKTKK